MQMQLSTSNPESQNNETPDKKATEKEPSLNDLRPTALQSSVNNNRGKSF